MCKTIDTRPDPFLANVPTLYLPENIKKPRFSDVFRGYKMGTLGRNGLSTLSTISDETFWESSERILVPSRRLWAEPKTSFVLTYVWQDLKYASDVMCSEK